MRALEKSNNRTGLAVSPELSAELRETVPPMEGGSLDDDALAETRAAYAEEAEPVGTMPPPAKPGGAARAATKGVAGRDAQVFMDKLGERLAFERSGVRLYQGLLSKFDVFGSWDGGPSRADLAHIRDEEYEHFLLMQRTIKELGGDATAVTPSANLQGVISAGVPCAIADPRTDLRECLEAILAAELVDNDGWTTLIDLARASGHDEHADAFGEALEHEEEHLANVRAWLAAGLNPAAGQPAKAKAKRRAAPKREMQQEASTPRSRQGRARKSR